MSKVDKAVGALVVVGVLAAVLYCNSKAIRDAADMVSAGMSDRMLERAAYFQEGRGQRPALEEPPPKDGD